MKIIQRVLLTFIVFSRSFFSCATNENTSEQSLLVDHAIAAFMHAHQAPGVVVAILDGNNEKILCYGLADKEKNIRVTENTLFEIASVTKVFTTTALAMQVLNGHMSLNDPITTYIPLPSNQSRSINSVTLLQLATHTSSLPRVGGDWHVGGFPKIMQFLQHWQPKHPIGTKYEYSNLAFGLLGYALESVEKKPYAEVIKNAILTPLGMYMTFTEVPKEFYSNHANGYNLAGETAPRRPQGYIPGSGALRSNAKDMLKFLKANMTFKGPEKLVKAMQFAQQPFYKVREHFIMGLGWQRFNKNGTLIIDKNGGLAGFTSYIGWLPQTQVGIVILTNKTKASTTEVGRFLLRQLSSAKKLKQGQ